MKILIVHNNYGRYCGEEAVVDKMAAMFQQHGHTVVFYRLTSEGFRDSLLGNVKGFFCGIYSPSGVKGMRDVLEAEHPDIVNVHNLYPFISPAALFECKKLGIPVIMTVHNFRQICPTGLFMRNGMPCEFCLQKGNEWGCIKFNCENSIVKSVGYAARNWFARRTGAYKNCVTQFACITAFQRQKLIEAGFSADKIKVIPNSLDVYETPHHSSTGEYVGFCGRISVEKGVDLILEVAKKHPEIAFKLAGAVREEFDTSNKPDNVEFMGYVSGDDLKRFYQNASFVIMASRCYEGFPMSILEAAKFGKTTIGPNHGGFTEIIGTADDAIGRLFKPADVNELESQIVYLWKHPKECERLGTKAFEKLKNLYSTEVVYKQWMDLIENTVKENKHIHENLL